MTHVSVYSSKNVNTPNLCLKFIQPTGREQPKTIQNPIALVDNQLFKAGLREINERVEVGGFHFDIFGQNFIHLPVSSAWYRLKAQSFRNGLMVEIC